MRVGWEINWQPTQFRKERDYEIRREAYMTSKVLTSVSKDVSTTRADLVSHLLREHKQKVTLKDPSNNVRKNNAIAR